MEAAVIWKKLIISPSEIRYRLTKAGVMAYKAEYIGY
jgi:hypothetical protein